jgi:murein DD-endopeptidase MepM/ murein hydrolase activator NlpD
MIKGEPRAFRRNPEAPMTKLARGTAGLALVCGVLAGCTTPHYPIREGEAAGPPPLTPPAPRYPVSQTAPSPDETAAAPTPPAAQAPAAEPPASVQTAAPAPKMDSQPLPPAASADTATFIRASTSPVPADTAASPATTPSDPAPPAPSSAPVETSTPQPDPPPRYRSYRREVRYAVSGEVVRASDVFQNYEVQKGDHIDALARGFGTTRKVLLEANHLKPPYRLHPGQIIRTPVAKAYVAESGDTLSGVGRRFGVDPSELAELNHISPHARLRSGEHIGLPSSMRDRGPLRVTASEPEYAEAAPESSPARYEPPPSYTPAYEPPPDPSPHMTPLTPSAPAPTPMRPAPSPYASPSAAYATPSAPAASPQAARGLSDAEVSAAARGRFVWPVRGDIVSGFGSLGLGRRNDGVDIKAAEGSSVKAAAPGEVVYAGDQVPGFGNLVLIKHADGWVTAYAHLDKIDVQMRQQVAQGQDLGSVGMSGGATQPELHFEVRFAPTAADKARPVDPVLVLPPA